MGEGVQMGPPVDAQEVGARGGGRRVCEAPAWWSTQQVPLPAGRVGNAVGRSSRPQPLRPAPPNSSTPYPPPPPLTHLPLTPYPPPAYPSTPYPTPLPPTPLPHRLPMPWPTSQPGWLGRSRRDQGDPIRVSVSRVPRAPRGLLRGAAAVRAPGGSSLGQGLTSDRLRNLRGCVCSPRSKETGCKLQDWT